MVEIGRRRHGHLESDSRLLGNLIILPPPTAFAPLAHFSPKYLFFRFIRSGQGHEICRRQNHSHGRYRAHSGRGSVGGSSLPAPSSRLARLKTALPPLAAMLSQGSIPTSFFTSWSLE